MNALEIYIDSKFPQRIPMEVELVVVDLIENLLWIISNLICAVMHCNVLWDTDLLHSDVLLQRGTELAMSVIRISFFN